MTTTNQRTSDTCFIDGAGVCIGGIMAGLAPCMHDDPNLGDAEWKLILMAERAVACPACSAGATKMCVTRQGTPTPNYNHPSRRELARTGDASEAAILVAICGLDRTAPKE